MGSVMTSLVQVPAWAQYPWLLHGFSTRLDGQSAVYGGRQLNLGFTAEDDRSTVLNNRAYLLHAIAGAHASTLLTIRQVHGTAIQVVGPGHHEPAQADGLITSTPGLLLGIQVADCVPVLVADTRRRIVAGFHAGWRGTVAGIVEQGIAQLTTDFASSPQDLVAAIGPSIRACCYSVGEEVHTRFHDRYSYAPALFSQAGGNLHLDLAEANRRQLLNAGLPADRITVLDQCTACARADGQRKYFSYRAEAGITGRAMGAIGIATVDPA